MCIGQIHFKRLAASFQSSNVCIVIWVAGAARFGDLQANNTKENQ
jgi:hypothetical protein